ncbi:MAG: adenylate/guanylate cyclase domain-containing protein [Desulfobacula sp.]
MIVVVFIFFGIITKLFVNSIVKTETALYQANELQRHILEKILPGNIVGRIRKEGKGFVDRHISCSVLYADIVGFTKLSEKLSPTQIVLFLNEIFGHFDDLTEKSGLQKIKTIGDAYMVASCSPMIKVENHADAMLNLAINFLDVIKNYKDISIRIGINSGMVMEGIIGGNKFSYDLWGEAVAIASKMETTCSPGNIHITQNTHSLLKSRYEFIKINPLKNDELFITSYQLKLSEKAC